MSSLPRITSNSYNCYQSTSRAADNSQDIKNGKKEDNIGRLLVAEFKDNDTCPFDEIMEVFRKYPDFQKYEVDYTPTISFPNLKILPDQRKVYCGKREVSLTTKEFNLLYYFAANEGRVLTYEQIY